MEDDMAEKADQVSEIHRKFAVDLFNTVWEYLEKPDRTTEENDTMLNAAHASRFHWEVVGKPVNLARGEWQLARVYTTIGRPEPAHYHARRCLEICQQHKIADFDLAYAYEALARIHAMEKRFIEGSYYLKMARQAGEQIVEADDKEHFFKDLENIGIE